MAEFSSPSIPPKKYRKSTLSGAYYDCAGSGGNFPSCTGNVGGTTQYSYSGDYIFDPATCAETSTQKQTVNGSIANPGTGCGTTFSAAPGFPIVNNLPVRLVLANGTDFTVTNSPTNQTGSFGGTCYNPTGSSYNKSQGSIGVDLTDEDTDDNAIARANAANPGIDWAACSDCGITCSAFKTVRTAGVFCLDWRNVQTQVSWHGIAGNYKATINYGRRILGTGGPCLFFASVDINVTLPVTGLASTPWQDMPNDQGYETIILSTVVVYVP